MTKTMKKKDSLLRRPFTGMLGLCALGIGVTLALTAAEERKLPMLGKITPSAEEKVSRSPLSILPQRAPTENLYAAAENPNPNLTANHQASPASEKPAVSVPETKASGETAKPESSSDASATASSAPADYAPFASADDRQIFNDLVDVYVYGYPLVLTNQMEKEMTHSLFFAPVNQMAYLTSPPTPGLKTGECPNVDTLMTTAWLDLAKGPQVVVIPENPRHDYYLELLDAWTGVIDSVNQKTGGDITPIRWDNRSVRPIVLVGPNDKTQVPEGMKVIQSPTETVWLINRVLLGPTDKKDSRNAAVCRTLYEFEILPLDRFVKESKEAKTSSDEAAKKTASLPQRTSAQESDAESDVFRLVDTAFVTAATEKAFQRNFSVASEESAPSAASLSTLSDLLAPLPPAPAASDSGDELVLNLPNLDEEEKPTAEPSAAPIPSASAETKPKKTSAPIENVHLTKTSATTVKKRIPTTVYEYKTFPGSRQAYWVKRVVYREEEAAQPTAPPTPAAPTTNPTSTESQASAPAEVLEVTAAEAEIVPVESKEEKRAEAKEEKEERKEEREEERKEEKEERKEERKERREERRERWDNDWKRDKEDWERYEGNMEEAVRRMERDMSELFARGYERGRLAAREAAEAGGDALNSMDKRAKRDLHRLARDMAPWMGGERWKERTVNRVREMNGQEFFTQFAELLPKNPPSARDQEILTKMKRLGIAPGEEFKTDKLSPKMRHLIRFAVPYAQMKIAETALIGKDRRTVENNWLIPERIGDYGTDYLLRAAVSEKFIGAEVPHAILYPFTSRDAEGAPLSGANRYRIHFDAGQTPPTDILWSITLYDDEFRLIPNRDHRYSVRSNEPLAFNEDGSLDLLISEDAPKEKISNWLPAPKEDFILMMRIYSPKESAFNGTWHLPAVTKLTPGKTDAVPTESAEAAK